VRKIKSENAPAFSTNQSKQYPIKIKEQKIPKTHQKETTIMILEKLKEIIADHSGEEADTITPETKFADLGIDSLTTVEILMDIEDEFGVSLEAGQIGTTVGELIAKIEEAQA
jgi:acyl carrier protein